MNGIAERALTLLILGGIGYMIYLKMQNKKNKVFALEGNIENQNFLDARKR